MATTFNTYKTTFEEKEDVEKLGLDLSYIRMEYPGKNSFLNPKNGYEIETNKSLGPDHSMFFWGEKKKQAGKKIKLEFLPVFEKGKNHTAKDFFIKAKISDQGELLAESDFQKAKKGKLESEFTVNKPFSFEMEDQIYYSDKITIEFIGSQNDNEDASSTVICMENFRLYITHEAPLDETKELPILEKILYFSCNQGKGKYFANKKDLSDALFDKFRIIDSNDVDKLFLDDFDPTAPHIALTYYKTTRETGEYSELISKVKGRNNTIGSGDCRAFMGLFKEILYSQGVDGYDVIIRVNNVDGFLVKHWNFIGDGTFQHDDPKYKNYNYYNTFSSIAKNTSPDKELSSYYLDDKGNYKFEVSGVEKIIDSLPGQGNKNPVADFYMHFIVKAENHYYDPSYGKDFVSFSEWIDESVAGVFKFPLEFKDMKNSNYMLIRKNGKIEEFSEQIFNYRSK